MFNEVYHENRALIGKYIEIFIDTPIDILRDRDPKYLSKTTQWRDKGVAGVDLCLPPAPMSKSRIN